MISIGATSAISAAAAPDNVLNETREHRALLDKARTARRLITRNLAALTGSGCADYLNVDVIRAAVGIDDRCCR